MYRTAIELVPALFLAFVSMARADDCNDQDRKWPFYPPSSPVVVHGGSVYAITMDKWSKSRSSHLLRTSVPPSPNTIELYGVQKEGDTGPKDVCLTASANWEIVLTFTNPSIAHLHICPFQSRGVCSYGGPLNGNDIFLANEQKDNMRVGPDSGKKDKRMDLEIGECKADPSIPNCDHIKSVELKGTPSDGKYACLGGVCVIAVDHK